MNKMFRVATLVACTLSLCAVLASNAYAYFDPATSGVLIQALVAVFVGIAVEIKLFWAEI